MKKIRFFWPEALLLLTCAIVLSVGISAKKGYHQDELLSFELANAEYNPWIVPTQPQGRLAKFVEKEIRGENLSQTVGNLWDTVLDVLKNRGNSKLLTYQADVYDEPVWIDRQAFVDYLTVDGKDAFHYLSVYFNVKDDNHPPLHFMLVHTVSSVFQGKLSPVMGCAINLIFVLGTMILLMRLGRIAMILLDCGEQGRITGAAAAALYGLSAGALSTTLLIRMYAMVTFFCVWLLNVHLEKFYHEKLSTVPDFQGKTVGFEKKNKLLIAVTVLGFWTQYFFLFYCLALAAVVAVLLFRRKRTKELIRYVLSMALAAVIGLVLFPFAIGDVFSSGRGVEALENARSGFGEFWTRILAFLEILGTACGMLCIFALLLTCFAWGILKMRGRKGADGLWSLLLIPVIAYFLCAAKLSPFLVDRYVMPVFPLLMLVLTVGAFGCLTALFQKKTKKMPAILVGVTAVLMISQPFASGHWDNAYLYPEYETQETAARKNRELPCICVYEGVRYYENLPEFMQYEKTLLLTEEELKAGTQEASIRELDRVAVLLKNKNWASDVSGVLKEYGFTPESTEFTSTKENGDLLLIYAKDRN